MMKLTFEETLRRELKRVNRKLDAMEREALLNGSITIDDAMVRAELSGRSKALSWVFTVKRDDT